MIDDQLFERAARSWIELGPTRAPDHAVEAALERIESIAQERMPRRPAPAVGTRGFGFPAVLRVMVVAAAIVVAIVGAAYIVVRAPSVGPAPTSSGAPSPTAGPTRSPTPETPAATPIDVGTWRSFTSSRFGISFKTPPDWTVTAASIPWTFGQIDPMELDQPPYVDQAIDRYNIDSMEVASEKLPAGMSVDTWWSAYKSDHSGVCFPGKAASETLDVDGSTAFVQGGTPECWFTQAIVLVGGRAYELRADYSYVNTSTTVFDPALFHAWLSTMRFEPATADDTPASPRPS